MISSYTIWNSDFSTCPPESLDTFPIHKDSTTLTLTLSGDLYGRLSLAAAQAGSTPADAATELITERLDQLERHDPVTSDYTYGYGAPNPMLAGYTATVTIPDTWTVASDSSAGIELGHGKKLRGIGYSERLLSLFRYDGTRQTSSDVCRALSTLCVGSVVSYCRKFLEQNDSTATISCNFLYTDKFSGKKVYEYIYHP